LKWTHAIIGSKDIWVWDGRACTAQITKESENQYYWEVTNFNGRTTTSYTEPTLEAAKQRAEHSIKELHHDEVND
jgi:hypothetical protein